MKVADKGVLATGADIELNFKKFPGAGFYSIVISEKPIAAETQQPTE